MNQVCSGSYIHSSMFLTMLIFNLIIFYSGRWWLFMAPFHFRGHDRWYRKLNTDFVSFCYASLRFSNLPYLLQVIKLWKGGKNARRWIRMFDHPRTRTRQRLQQLLPAIHVKKTLLLLYFQYWMYIVWYKLPGHVEQLCHLYKRFVFL